MTAHITARIDFRQMDDGRWAVTKFYRTSDGVYLPFDRETHAEAEDNIVWMIENDWSVRRWPGGARGWKGAPERVRRPEQARKLIADLERSSRTSEELREILPELDATYDL